MDRLRRVILAEHRETITAVVDAGATVAAAIEEWPVTDGDVIRQPLDRLLRDRGLDAALLGALDTGADALDSRVQGQPVAAPPYFVVTSRGPICRGTLADGRRLVIEYALFDVDTQPRRYQFVDTEPEQCLQVTLASHSTS